MASWKETILHWKKKLEKGTSDEKTLQILGKLQKVPITVTLLQETGIGKIVNGFKKQNGEIGDKARKIVASWKLIVTSENSQSTTVSSKRSNSPVKHEKRISNQGSHGPQTSQYEQNSPDNESPSYTNGDNSPVQLNYESSSQKRDKYSPHASKSASGYRNSNTYSSGGEVATDSYNPQSTQDDYKSFVHTYQESDEIEEPAPDEYVPSSSSSQNGSMDTYKPSRKEKLPGSLYNPTSTQDDYKNFVQSYQDDPPENSDPEMYKPENKPSVSSPKPGTSKQDKNRHKDPKSGEKSKKKSKTEPEGFDNSVASFEACLGFNDVVGKKSKPKPKPTVPPTSHMQHLSSSSATISNNSNTISNSSTTISNSSTSRVSHTPKKASSKEKKSSQSSKRSSHSDAAPVKRSKSSKRTKEIEDIPKELKKPKLLPLEEVDVLATLPEIQPNYKPLRLRMPDSPPHKKKIEMTNEEATLFFSSRKEKTAVYAGRKNQYLTEVPSLFESCIKVLVENIDGLGHTGGVPYDLLKPILDKCTPAQLYSFEDYNTYVLEETDELWLIHSHRDFKGKCPEEGETWRDLYLRLHDEREARLKSITANISASMKKAVPVRQTKLAYVDSVAKPPRDVARRQQRHGTSLPDAFPMKAGMVALGRGTPRPIMAGMNSAASAGSSSSSAMKKPKVAPLMQKTLTMMKQRFRR